MRKNEALQIKTRDATQSVNINTLANEVKAAQSAPMVARDGTQGESPDPNNVAVVISADRTVQYESVVKVMDTLQKAGIQRVGLSVQLVNN